VRREVDHAVLSILLITLITMIDDQFKLHAWTKEIMATPRRRGLLPGIIKQYLFRWSGA
jgi:hypothetical protein